MPDFIGINRIMVKERYVMFKSKNMRKTLSMLCVLCMLVSIIAGRANAFAFGGDEILDDTVIEQEQNVVTNDEEPGQTDEDLIQKTEEPELADIEQIQIDDEQFQDNEPVQINEVLNQTDDNLTNDADAPTSANLADFLTDVTINAPVDGDGNYVINPNNTYELTFRFSENEDVQFDDDSIMTYDIPEGLITGDINSTTFSIVVTDENGTATINGNTFEVIDGQLRVHFNQDDPHYDRLIAAANVKFDLSIYSRLDETASEIYFSSNIEKDFVFETWNDLAIYKEVNYDSDSDTAFYKVVVTSYGNNDNVLIEDTLTGTALIFNKDVSAESNKSGQLALDYDYTSVENRFRVTIDHMGNEEVITLTYSAAVDNNKISSNGTVEQTNNKARVTSDQVPYGKEASTNFAGKVQFHRVQKYADGDPVKVGDNLYEQDWVITVNEDHKINMGGVNIADWIVQNSRPFMSFTGDGITISVTFENGTTQTRVVPWSDLYIWENANGIWGWRYTAPDTDGKASYRITSSTIIDSSSALGNLTLVNGAQVLNSYDEGTTQIGVIGETDFGIRKEAVGTTETESEWQNVISVPATGLSNLRVVDDGPKLIYGDQTYIDYFIKDSFEIEGLQEGESWNISFENDERTFVINFYQDEGKTQGGVKPSADGNPRNIIIHYKTSVNQDWLTMASYNGYNDSNLYKHVNYATVWSGTYRTDTVNATVIPVKKSIYKEFAERKDIEIDGVTYPVFKYRLSLTGVNEDGVTIADSFNTNYLKYYEADGIKISGGNNNNITTEGGSALAVSTSDGIDMVVDSFPKQNNGNYYQKYIITYSLIVKDEAALSALNEEAALAQWGVNMENIAKWNELESRTTVNYTYTSYVNKEITSWPSSDNGYIAEFKVTINQNGEDLDPTSDELTIMDELSSNLRFVPDSLSINPESENIVVQHDEKTNTLIFNGVPDNTPFEIIYKARVLGKGNVQYSNTVKVGKYEKKVEQWATVVSSGAGTASNPSITLVKVDADDITVTLAGATFQLFYLNANGDKVPVRDRNGNDVTFTTGADGTVLIVGNQQRLGWTLWANRTYCLVEIQAPEGYEVSTEDKYFVLTDDPANQTEYDITGDQLNIKDEHIKFSIPVEKKWVGPETDSVTVNLTADGVIVDKIELSPENEWKHIFTNIPEYDEISGAKINYDVSEVPVKGYTQEYSGDAETGFIITNTAEEEEKDENPENDVPIKDTVEEDDNNKTVDKEKVKDKEKDKDKTKDKTSSSTNNQESTTAVESKVIVQGEPIVIIDMDTNTPRQVSNSTPNTGDDGQLLFFIIIMILSGTGIICLFILYRISKRRFKP